MVTGPTIGVQDLSARGEPGTGNHAPDVLVGENPKATFLADERVSAPSGVALVFVVRVLFVGVKIEDIRPGA
jgi:hypothetical protein